MDRWQHSSSLLKAIESSLTNECCCDVTIQVEDTRLRAHKYILSIRSSVLEKKISNSTSDVIILEDVDPVVFPFILRYMYTDKGNIDNENVLSVLCASIILDMSHLTSKCVDFITKILTVDNVCGWINISTELKSEILATKCFDVLANRTSAILQSKTFLDLSHDALKKILMTENVSCKEFDIFEALHRWARNTANSTKADIKEIVKPFLHLTRFPTMSKEEFLEVEEMDILEEVDIARVMTYILAPSETRRAKLAFSAEPRKMVKSSEVVKVQQTAVEHDIFHPIRVENCTLVGDIATYSFKPVALLISKQIPRQQNTAQIEIEILQTGRIGAITIGVVTSTFPSGNHPGWCKDSWGYHADDGGLYMERRQSSRRYQRCGTGDRLKVELDIIRKQIRFSVNGQQICEINVNIRDGTSYHFAVGMYYVGESVKLFPSAQWR